MANFNRVPEFSKDDFENWIIRMRAHLAARDNDMWYTITNGHIQILKANTSEDIKDGGPQMVEKPRSEWTAEEKRLANLDNVAKDILYRTLDKNTFNKIKMCSTSKKIWDKLTQICQGNEATKENKLYVAIQKFENVKMMDGESLNNFDERFSGMVNDLTVLGKVLTNREVVLKVMKTLPREWDVKTMAMRVSRDFNKLELHELFDELKAYEFELEIRNGEEPYQNLSQAFVVSPVPVVAVAVSHKILESSSSDGISLLTKKFSKFMKKDFQRQNHDYQKSRGDYKSIRRRKQHISSSESSDSNSRLSSSSSSSED